MYGLLIMMNMRYYYDLFYRNYVVDRYGRQGLAFRDIWGTANFLRISIHLAAWSVGGLFWVWTFLPSAYGWILFSYITMALAIVQLGRILMVLVLECFAMMLDNYDTRYLKYNNF